MALAAFVRKFATPSDCLDHLVSIRRRAGVVCPSCRSSKFQTSPRRRSYTCAECWRRFQITSGTIFEDIPVSMLPKWFAAIYLVTVHRPGISGAQLAQVIGVSTGTARQMIQRITQADGVFVQAEPGSSPNRGTPSAKRVVCLANSRKGGDRCIAGREWVDETAGAWVRPIGDQENQAVSDLERQYRGGREPRVLDIIDIPLLEPVPSRHQRENWTISPDRRWRRVGKLTHDYLDDLLDSIAPLWIDGFSSGSGLNNRVPENVAGQLEDSLRLIRVSDLQVEVRDYFGRRVQGQFSFHGSSYLLRVTDPICEDDYVQRPEGNYDVGEAYLTISLGESYNDGYCYKLIAAVIRPPVSTSS